MKTATAADREDGLVGFSPVTANVSPEHQKPVPAKQAPQLFSGVRNEHFISTPQQ
jgi:hypothetical protein